MSSSEAKQVVQKKKKKQKTAAPQEEPPRKKKKKTTCAVGDDATSLSSVSKPTKKKKQKQKKTQPVPGCEDAAAPAVETQQEGVETEDAATQEKKPAGKRRRRDDADEDVSASAEEEEEDEEERTVYVEGLPYAADEARVAALFAERCGAVKEVRLPRYHDSGKPRGYAHVEFNSHAGARAALAWKDPTLGERYLTVARPNAKRHKLDAKRAESAKTTKPVGCRTVFVGNLPYDANEDHVRHAFVKCGKIDDVRLPAWAHTGRAKGHGYVQFVKEIAAERAVASQSDIYVRGRPVFVSYETTQRPKQSFRVKATGQPWTKTKAGKRLLGGSRSSPTPATAAPAAKKQKVVQRQQQQHLEEES